MIVLGLSFFYHDSAAALVIDGQIVAAAEEERFSRKKHDSNFPKNAVDFCLAVANITIEKVDKIVFYEKPFDKFERIILSSLSFAPKGRQSVVHALKSWLKDKIWIKTTIEKHLGCPAEAILFNSHHLSHAASAYYTSPFQSAALLTCDGVGEWTTTAWGKARGNKINLNSQIRFPHSLGLFYSTFTQFLGFEINEGEFKVMGLASFGKPTMIKEVEKLITQKADGSFSLNMEYFNFQTSDKTSFSSKFIELFKLPPLEPGKSDQVLPAYANLAASAQKVLEDKLLVIAKHIHKKTKEDNLCYAGGVALNGMANWRIFKEAGFKRIFVHPAAGDSGGALGAALYTYYLLSNAPKVTNPFPSVYLGQENLDKDIEAFCKKNRLKFKKLSDSRLEDRVVTLLINQKVVGWVQDRFEWGPRALGNRSILADPRRSAMKDLVNGKIKFREGFRPFAPVTLFESGYKYFKIPKKLPSLLEYMLAVVPVRPLFRKKLGAITHVDNSARPQFLRESSNPRFYRLIKKFGQKTGIPVLLNTSFNLKGEPIVNTIAEAYRTFKKSGLDALVVGNYLIEK